MWRKDQKARVGQYRNWCGLTEFEYRQIMMEETGVNSARARELNNNDFDCVMVRLEEELETRIAAGRTNEPVKQYNPNYWRAKIPGAGKLTNRQMRAIKEGWEALAAALPMKDRTAEYALDIMTKAIKRRPRGVSDLTGREAGLVINAMHGRLGDIETARNKARA